MQLAEHLTKLTSQRQLQLTVVGGDFRNSQSHLFIRELCWSLRVDTQQTKDTEGKTRHFSTHVSGNHSVGVPSQLFWSWFFYGSIVAHKIAFKDNCYLTKAYFYYYFFNKGATITWAERKICYSTHFLSLPEPCTYLNPSTSLQLLGNVCYVSGG